MKIGLDMDEVLANFMEGFFKFYNSKFSKNISHLDMKNYHLFKILGGTHQEAVSLVDDFHDSEFFDSMTSVDGAKEALASLKDHELVIITARPRKFSEKTIKFLRNNFPWRNFSVFYSSEVHGHEGTKNKAEICNDLGIKIIVEDSADHSPLYANSGIKVILLDKPWNKNCEEHENIIRVKDWKGALEKIKEFEGKSLEAVNG